MALSGSANAAGEPPDSAPLALARLGFALRGGAFLLGLCLAVGLLQGDAEGRVNLLYLLLLFVLLPLAMLLGGVALLLVGRRGIGLEGLLALSVWPAPWARALGQLHRRGSARPWFFMQSHACGTLCATGLLLGFLLMLTGTDVSFVWRSTLLDAVDLLPLLQWLALPWTWWTDAQPGIALLELTRDSRLAPDAAAPRIYGQWWRFLLMAQLVYNLAPRALGWLAGAWLFARRERGHRPRAGLRIESGTQDPAPGAAVLAPQVSAVTGDFALLRLIELPAACRQDLRTRLGAPVFELAGLSLDALEDELRRRDAGLALVVAVDALESPLAELHDLLSGRHGYLLPLGVAQGGWRAPDAQHVDEWRRFTRTLPGDWRVLQPEASA